MASLDLIELELRPLNDCEIQDTDGGIWLELAVGAVVAGVIADWSDFKKGLVAGLQAN